MRITIEPAKCIASGGCRLAAPKVFGQDEDGVVTVLLPEPPEALRASARAAATACPAAVITVEED
jgi:ferredoxin